MPARGSRPNGPLLSNPDRRCSAFPCDRRACGQPLSVSSLRLLVRQAGLLGRSSAVWHKTSQAATANRAFGSVPTCAACFGSLAVIRMRRPHVRIGQLSAILPLPVQTHGFASPDFSGFAFLGKPGFNCLSLGLCHSGCGGVPVELPVLAQRNGRLSAPRCGSCGEWKARRRLTPGVHGGCLNRCAGWKEQSTSNGLARNVPLAASHPPTCVTSPCPAYLLGTGWCPSPRRCSRS